MMNREQREANWRLWRPILAPRSAKDWAGAVISWICMMYIVAALAMPIAIWRGWIR